MEKYPNIIILLNLPSDYIPKAEFVFRTYCYILRLNPTFVYGNHYEGTHIYYGLPTEREYPVKIFYGSGTAEFFQMKDLYPLDKVNFSKFKGEYIPFLFSQPGAVFAFNPESIVFRKDIISSGFYFLSCWHEYILGFHGERKGRVDYRQSLQYRWDFIEVPVVDVYCQMLLYAMSLHLPQFVREIPWSGSKRFCISLSHDIDYWDYWTKQQKKNAFRYNLRTFAKRPATALYKIVGHTLHKNLIHNPHRLMRWIIKSELKLGVRSSWFIFGKHDYDDSRQNYLAMPKVRSNLLNCLVNQEIGLHGSPASAYDSATLKEELQELRNLGLSIKGYRSHYLNFDYQKSFKLLEEAGVLYDSTLGYWENVGFRAGISYPFYPFNIKENRPFRVLEIPLIIMDTTMYSQKAMNMTPGAALRNLKRMVDLAEKYQSHLSILWHNVSFDPIDYPMWAGVYWDILKYALRRDAWVTSLEEVYNEWVNLA